MKRKVEKAKGRKIDFYGLFHSGMLHFNIPSECWKVRTTIEFTNIRLLIERGIKIKKNILSLDAF